MRPMAVVRTVDAEVPLLPSWEATVNCRRSWLVVVLKEGRFLFSATWLVDESCCGSVFWVLHWSDDARQLERYATVQVV